MQKRIIMLLTVVALMMVMLVSGVASAAFAATLDAWGCRVGDNFSTDDGSIVVGLPPDRNDDGKFCIYTRNGKSHFADNRKIQ